MVFRFNTSHLAPAIELQHTAMAIVKTPGAKFKKIPQRQRRRREPTTPLAYRTLRGWAIGTLTETHAIIECPEHGYIRDRGTWAHGWAEAREIARSQPFVGASADQCLAELDEIMASIGDECPEC